MSGIAPVQLSLQEVAAEWPTVTPFIHELLLVFGHLLRSGIAWATDAPLVAIGLAHDESAKPSSSSSSSREFCIAQAASVVSSFSLRSYAAQSGAVGTGKLCVFVDGVPPVTLGVEAQDTEPVFHRVVR